METLGFLFSKLLTIFAYMTRATFGSKHKNKIERLLFYYGIVNILKYQHEMLTIERYEECAAINSVIKKLNKKGWGLPISLSDVKKSEILLRAKDMKDIYGAKWIFETDKNSTYSGAKNALDSIFDGRYYI